MIIVKLQSKESNIYWKSVQSTESDYKTTDWNNLRKWDQITEQKKRSYSIEICLNVFNGSFIFFMANGDEKRNK
jgi:hypothetical protein